MLWENIKNAADSVSGLWFIGGDFNEVSKAAEKFGGLRVNFTRVIDF